MFGGAFQQIITVADDALQTTSCDARTAQAVSTMSPTAVMQDDAYSVEVYDRPGKNLPLHEKLQLQRELRACAALSLRPLPDYQCLSSAPDVLDDKLIVVLRPAAPDSHLASPPLAAFLSAVCLSIPPSAQDGSTAPLAAVHTGLTCVAPAHQRTGLTKPLVAALVRHACAQPAFARGAWLTSLAAVPSSLGAVLHYATRVHPAPFSSSSPSSTSAPTPTHLRIADAIVSSPHLRAAMHIAPDAAFDRARFAFRGAEPPGSCFRKDRADARWAHREGGVNAFYVGLLGREAGDAGDEVLQVAFVEWAHLFGVLERDAAARRGGRDGRAEMGNMKVSLWVRFLEGSL